MLFGSGGARLLVVEDQAEEALELLETATPTDQAFTLRTCSPPYAQPKRGRRGHF